MKVTKIRQKCHAMELLLRLSPEPTCAVALMLELLWSPEWLDEQIAELRRRSIQVRRAGDERLAIGRGCWPRAKRRAEAYARSMGYDAADPQPRPLSAAPGGPLAVAGRAARCPSYRP